MNTGNDMNFMTPHNKTRRVEMPDTPGGKNEPPTNRSPRGVLKPTKLVFAQPPSDVAVTTALEWVADVWAAYVAEHGNGPKGPN